MKPKLTIRERILPWLKKEGDCLVWSRARSGAGYGEISINGWPNLVHRVVWEMENGPIPKGLWILHRCDNRPCANINHLFIGTPKDNMQDMISKGRKVVNIPLLSGENSHRAKLKWHQVNEIRMKYSVGNETQRKLAKAYGVNQYCIWAIVNNRVWKIS